LLAHALWKTLAASCRQAGLGDEPRQMFKELSDITLVDVVLPTRNGVEIRKRCIRTPTDSAATTRQEAANGAPTNRNVVETLMLPLIPKTLFTQVRKFG